VDRLSAREVWIGPDFRFGKGRAGDLPMLRTLGAHRRTVLKGLLAEFATLGVLSGLLASAGASIAGVYVARRVLQIPYTADPWVWIYGIIGGGLLVCVAGWLATRSVVNQPPVLTLRSG